MLPLKPQLNLSRFSAYPRAGLVVLTKVNCTSSVTKDYRKKMLTLSNVCYKYASENIC